MNKYALQGPWEKQQQLIAIKNITQIITEHFFRILKWNE